MNDEYDHEGIECEGLCTCSCGDCWYDEDDVDDEEFDLNGWGRGKGAMAR